MENTELNLAPIEPAPLPAAERLVKVTHKGYGEESEVPADSDFEALAFLGWEKAKGKAK